MNRIDRAIRPFVQHPWSSLLLSVLLLLLAVLFALDLLPPARKYGPWHGAVMALLSGGVAGFFGWCARRGFGSAD